VELTLGLILLAAGIIATQKVYKGQRGISELIITASIAAGGFILIATAFAVVMETIGCGKYYTGVGLHVELYLYAASCPPQLYLWVFAIKYLTKGIEYTRVKGGDCVAKTLKIGLYILWALYEVYMVSVISKYAWTYPEFRP
jgi:hypothetical protein